MTYDPIKKIEIYEENLEKNHMELKKNQLIHFDWKTSFLITYWIFFRIFRDNYYYEK